jgi:hypothetical protein
MGNLCARIPNVVPKAQASPAFPQTRHYDKNAWPTQADFSHTSAVPICPNQTEQLCRPMGRHLADGSPPARYATTLLGVRSGSCHTVVDVRW